MAEQEENKDIKKGFTNNSNKDRDDKRPSFRLSPDGMGKGGLGWLLFLAILLLIIAVLGRNYRQTTRISISQFYTYLENNQIERVIVRDGLVSGKLKSLVGQSPSSSLDFEVRFPKETTQSPEFIKELEAICRRTGTELRYEPSDNAFLQILLSLIPWLLIFGFIWFFIFRQIKSAAGGAGMLGNFGRSRHKIISKEKTGVTFEDVAGIDEAKEEVREIVEFLKNPEKFQKLGGRIPRGVLLIGEPGCGKTLLAKAIAGEADVPFFSISGSDFVEMFVGVGASRVRDLFSQAKANAPCIVFLDEIDAVGRRRGIGFNGGHDEREQTLNAILVEIDGFDSSDQVIVIAATNRPDVLDPALTRPGRFDRQVYVPLPDIKGRYEILKVHAKKIKLAPDVDLWKIARGTPMFSGAELAALINEAAISATLAGKEYVEMEDLEEARDKIRWGKAKKSRVMDESERKVIAYHEAGHALVAAMIEGADPLHKVSIIPRAQAGGMTMMLPETDRHVYTRRYLLAQLKVLLAGRVAEEEVCGDISSGAADDIKRATQLARTMVCEWGMSDTLGPVRIGFDDTRPWPAELASKDYSERTAELIDQEVQKLIRDSYNEVKNIIKENRQRLERLAESLLKYETLEADEVKKILENQTIEKVTISDLINNEVRKEAQLETERDSNKQEDNEGKEILTDKVGREEGDSI